MKLPCSWLQELSGVAWSPDVIAKRLTASGTAGEAAIVKAEDFAHIVIGRILSCEKHPNADRLTVTEVDTGDGTHTIVCGAPNCAAGQKVVVALPGAVLKGEFAIKPVKMRGVESNGMICAEDELGLSNDHSGIMVLSDDAPIGGSVYEYLGLNDAIFDFEITPNRPDSLSAMGVARELAVLDKKRFSYTIEAPKENDKPASDMIKVIIEDPDACPRYTARIIENVTIGPSPWWMRKRLMDCGVRPINNIVDISNYVMLETGQPLHAFDYHTFGLSEVVVRRGKKGEKFTTLDDQERTLDDDILMITNGKEGVAVAGVMGGLFSEVTDKTTTVLLESAYFDPSLTRRSRGKLGLNTESSYRFERGVDPNFVIEASNRAAFLIAELAGGEVRKGVVDTYAKRIEPVKLDLRRERITRLLGIDVGNDFIEETFAGLGMDVTMGDPVKVTVPTFRPDITREVDLIEEVARIYGLDNIPTSHQNSGPLYTPTHPQNTVKSEIRNILTGFGFDEIMGTGFANPDRMLKIDPTCATIAVTNPLSDELAIMRPRMMYSLLLAAGNNVRHRNIDFKLFEIGLIYLRGETWPIEQDYIGMIVTGQADDIYWKTKSGSCDLYELKGVIDGLADGVNAAGMDLTPEKVPGYQDKLSYTIHSGGERIGVAGQVDPGLCRLFDIKQPCFAAEINIEAMLKIRRGLVEFAPIPKFPSSSRDIALVVDHGIPSADMLNEIRTAGGDLVESVHIFDLFTGGQVPEGKVSLAFSVNYRSPDKTLEDEEVDSVHNRIIAHLEKQFNARLRE